VTVPATVPVASLVVPAHDEEATVGRGLRRALAGARPGEFEVVVVSNGSSDGTVAAARAAAPAATVLDLPEPGKIGALQAGDDAATAFPRVYLDADVELDTSALRRLAVVLRDGPVLCAAPRPVFATAGCPWPVRAFFSTYQRLPYLREEPVGTGCYAVSAAGRARFGAWPPVINDDLFVGALFSRAERRTLRDETFTVHPPRTLRALVAVRRRVYRGNAEQPAAGTEQSAAGGIAGLARDPRAWPGLAVYLGVNGVARLLARRGPAARWERDHTSRAARPG